MGKKKCFLCGKEYKEKEILCPKCFAGKSKKEKEFFAKMLNTPQIKNLLSMTPQDLLAKFISSKVEEFMSDYVKTDEGKAMLKGSKEILDKLSPEFKKVLSLISQIPSEAEKPKIYADFFHGSRLGQPKRVRNALKRLDSYFPNEEAIWEEYVHSHFLSQDRSPLELYETIDLLTASLEKDQNSPFKWGLLGLMYGMIDKYDDALESLEKQIKIAPNNIKPYKTMAIVYESKKDVNKAKEYLELYLKSYPNDTKSQKMLNRLNSKLQGKEVETPQTFSQSRILGKFLNYFRDNKGKAFSGSALNNRLEDILEDPAEREYGRKNLQYYLREMVSNGWIKSAQHGEEIHYFFPT
ncbi:MAG: tetratricopeptide repeat protein [Promethearchaeota archaeon]